MEASVRSPSVFECLAIAVATTAAVLSIAPAARADDKQVCSDAYDKTQSLRKAGKLIESRAQALVCGREVCAEFVRVDCAKWVGEIDSSQPTIVLEVRDGAGRDLTAVSVALDGSPWLSALDGKAQPVDPGSHALRVSAAGQPDAEETVVAREGEKNKRVTITLGAPPRDDTGEPPAADATEGSLAPWIIGGVGVASLVVGGILAIVVSGDKSTFDEHCDDATETCDAEGIDAKESGQTLGPISTIALIAGAVGVGVGTVWIVAESTAEEEDAASIGASPMVSTEGGGLRLRGRF